MSRDGCEMVAGGLVHYEGLMGMCVPSYENPVDAMRQ